MNSNVCRIGMTIGLVMCLISASTIYAEDGVEVQENFRVATGFYVGGSVVSSKIRGGDFDDTIFLSDGSDLFDVPDLKNGKGFGVMMGVRGPIGAMELGYQRTKHDTSSVLFGDNSAAYNSIDINFKLDVLGAVDALYKENDVRFPIDVLNRIRPYGILGFGIPWLTIKDSTTDGGSPSNETFVGFGWNWGGGLAIYLTPRLALTGELTRRNNRFRTVEGIKIEDKVKLRSTSYSVGVSYTF